MALRKRIKNRIKDRFGKKDDNLDDGNDGDLNLESVSENDISIPNDSEENTTNTNDSNIGLKQTSSNNILNDKDYITDFCKDKRFNQEELKIIIKVIRAELEPILSIITIMINIIQWNNIPISFISFIMLLLMAYKNYVHYIPGIIFIMLSICMLNYKYKSNKLMYVLTYVEYMTDPAIKMDASTVNNDSKNNKTNDESSDENIKRWQIIKRAKKVKKKLKKVKTSLGSIQYFFWELSIQFGKLRSIYFFKANNTSMNMYYGLLICGILSLLIPFRIIYTLMICLIFFINNPLRNKPKIPKIVHKIKNELATIKPDIPII